MKNKWLIVHIEIRKSNDVLNEIPLLPAFEVIKCSYLWQCYVSLTGTVTLHSHVLL